MAHLAKEKHQGNADVSTGSPPVKPVSNSDGNGACLPVESPARKLLTRLTLEHETVQEGKSKWSIGRAFRLIVMSCCLFWASMYLLSATVF